MANKVAVLHTALSLEEFLQQNPQYEYSQEDDTLSGPNLSWAFIFKSEDSDEIYLTAEHHVPEDMLFELLSKYGGWFYASEYDRKPSLVFPLPTAPSAEDRTVAELLAEAAQASNAVNAEMDGRNTTGKDGYEYE